ncbi:protein serine/threonine phosphatase 2C [Didymella exigua CBS 183.55]|uniref:Protein serine/threonine phosphatase 2C n=1 Tax=Didymella exigua CBS 183.55 TaxID=1150837 RepID=A0A6A5RCI0_9PLEO|nr:protein serine/threonine phosphatase 2C [Didymella exigua CBS 183.55]KAF1924784.1 protein serine/threonine phosphatase 2C [Didymella exigua CBS 183.55]
MLSSRVGNTARLRCLSSTQLVAPARCMSAAGSRRACFRPQTRRVASLQSRALHHFRPLTSQQTFSKTAEEQAEYQNGLAPTILQSAFPKKTFAILVTISALAYYFVDVRDLDWTDDVVNSFGYDNVGVTPLQFFASKDELDHFLQHHTGDPSHLMKDPQVAQFMSEHFDKLAGGWRMTEKDAAEESISVTHGCRFKSNEPCEDYFAFGTSPGPGQQPWNYWSIMDGHAGRHTSFMLQRILIPSLSSALLTLPAHTSPFEIESTIKNTFLRIDKQIMDSARTAANWFPAANAAAIGALAPAFSGSCALLAAFDPASSVLRVACIGDSRAVLGRWDPSTRSYTCIPLSEDQTGFNEKEVKRITEAHPDEPDILDPKTGRLMGLAVTRAFGDHRWKWDNEFVKMVQAKFWGSSPRPQSKTAPYMTAEPEVTETDIVRHSSGKGKSDFMIMASDGLWDRISSEHAVECVERWLEARDRGHGEVKNDPRLQLTAQQFENPMVEDSGFTYNAETGEQVEWKATPEYFAIEDENAAVCLARNAMGGTRRALFMGVLNAPPPMGRYAVDDTTIMVVFFDKLDEQTAGKQAASKAGMGEKKSWWKPW